jgi:hypothetical protein
MQIEQESSIIRHAIIAYQNISITVSFRLKQISIFINIQTAMTNNSVNNLSTKFRLTLVQPKTKLTGNLLNKHRCPQSNDLQIYSGQHQQQASKSIEHCYTRKP